MSAATKHRMEVCDWGVFTIHRGQNSKTDDPGILKYPLVTGQCRNLPQVL